jgi:pimeloyl-ACP methyl ester carboxylesterase
MAQDYCRDSEESQGIAALLCPMCNTFCCSSEKLSLGPGMLQVYAIDLLGFGGSEKALLDYSIELWAEQVVDFCQEFVETPVTLVGNSIGSLVSLEAAKMMKQIDGGPGIQGLALINCAGAFVLIPRTRLDMVAWVTID